MTRETLGRVARILPGQLKKYTIYGRYLLTRPVFARRGASVITAEQAIAALVFGFGLGCMVWIPAYCFERAKDVLNVVGTSE